MTPTDTEVEQALAWLTKAQRVQLTARTLTSDGRVLVPTGALHMDALDPWPSGFLEPYSAHYSRITPLGLAVRARLAASGMEAHRAETEGLGPKADSPVAKPDAPTTPTQSGDA